MDHIIGQSRAIDVLQSSLRSGRVPHAFIFHGPAGVGKFTTALGFARVMLCHEPANDLSGNVAACGACESCKLIPDRPGAAASSAHPDLHLVVKELALYSEDRQTRERKLSNIPLAVLEQHVLQPVSRSALLRHNKVVVVDEAELIDARGQNLLLKTLEEPPAGTYVVLVTSSEHELLPTIRSRCQRVAFLPLPEETIRAWAEEHAHAWSPQSRAWLTDFAGGSLGRAALAVEYDLGRWAQRVLPAIDAAAQGKYPSDLGGAMGAMMDEFAKSWVDRHEKASKDAANKLGASLMWAVITHYARRKMQTLAAKVKPDDPVAAESSLEPWAGVIDAVNDAEREIDANVQMSLASDHLVSRLFRGMTGRV
ncbi:MAG: hypothetical protein K8S99_12170 [Planctomycetes bacterium]|nr:hypothetical protein [Planctomycetota bacterium]